eukprot:GHRR01009717.1.p1 GENE.GHRR01009717.1~~GHRR01009717.1.p1  ORF type:complete len:467 (+),score=173.45 GHRR01009717.1:218-1618(+)
MQALASKGLCARIRYGQQNHLVQRLPLLTILPHQCLPQHRWTPSHVQPEQLHETQPVLQHRPDVSCAAGGAAAASDAPQPAYTTDFIRRRLLVFFAIVVGYSSYYLTRNSLTYTAPVMVADPTLGMDITQIGAMTSIFPIAYGMSKFVSGVLGAKFSPSVLLAGGLMATAVINIAFGFGSSLAWFCFFWALNGTLQGVGGPCCARILTTWFASKERGTYWGMWNIAHNLGGFAAPLIAGGFAKSMGWKWGMWAPGIIGLVVGTFVLLTCKDKPEDLGYPAVEPTIAKAASDGEKTKPNVLKQLVENVLKNPFIWGMALTYFFIYVVRQGVTSWFVFYLIKEKGVADAAQAAVRVSGLELGGLVGSLIAGRLSDMLINKSEGKGGAVGKRVQVVMAYTVGIAASLLAFQYVPATAAALQWFNVFMIGFFLYGPQMLIGLCGAELVGPESVGASEGFLGWIAYLGKQC